MSDNKPTISVNNVSMVFRMLEDRAFSFKEFITRKLSGKIKYNSFQALDGISFTINKGDVVGLIGKNGAGKSTLLKIVSGILKPSSGTVTVNGNIVPMLELGSGFDMELTGRENIYLNGAILGYPKAFIEEKYRDILNFSELESFIDVPLRNYSSGMVARLAFSIATVVEPDILIVDEVLSVGDERFQAKSYKRMKELMKNGSTVLFVSHSTEQVEALCNKAIWLENGKIAKIGDAHEVCLAYSDSMKQ